MAYANRVVLKNPASIEVDGVEFKDQLWKVRLVPDQPVLTQRTFGGVDQDTDSAVWTLEVSGHQYRGTGGFVAAVDTALAAGNEMEFVIQFEAGVGKEVITVSVTPVAIEAGGEVGGYKSFEASFPVIDSPAFSTSV